MKLQTNVNEITLSGVGEVGEFRIRNSAKAFKILSDGLYSNKIRAIIRELSCNAIDSHIAAGKAEVPFEVHLPSSFEPYFAVRDFGTGLSGEQVTSIYTTYFESSKTDSNDFIGALGLGSKSPFSYTENFTITAIKDGIKRIYSAFINEKGIPSVVEMGVDATEEGNGVEVKFSVVDQNDFWNFREEAAKVFKWFSKFPTITGHRVELYSVRYKEKDIVPGVHLQDNQSGSYALMGNIPYPLNNMPDSAKKKIGGVVELLNCGLVLEFGIGELDFAASREQLSYIDITIDSIKAKLDLLNANLALHIAEKANLIENLWERADYLYEQRSISLYKEAVTKYVTDTKFPLFDTTSNCYGRKTLQVFSKDLEAKNITFQGFTANRGSTTRMKESTTAVKTTSIVNGKNVNNVVHEPVWNIGVSGKTFVVLNDLKIGCFARARSHFITYSRTNPGTQILCLNHNAVEYADRKVAYDELPKELHYPPNVILASSLDKITKAKTSGTGLMVLEPARHQYNVWSWKPFHEEIDDSTIYYYVNMVGHTPMDASGKNVLDVDGKKRLMHNSGIAELHNMRIIGVRKSRIEEISELDNWVWFEDKIRQEIAKVNDRHIASLVAAEALDSYETRVYTNREAALALGKGSYYKEYVEEIANVPRLDGNITSLASLCRQYGKTVVVEKVVKTLTDAKDKLIKTYPMLKHIHYSAAVTDVVDYIRLIDKLGENK